MAAPVYTYVTVLDEVRLALNMKGSDAFLTDDEIESFIFENIVSESATYTFQKVLTGKLYKYYGGFAYGLFLWGTNSGAPTFTGETDVEYTIRAKGSIEVTTGTHSTDTIDVAGARVDFPHLMTQLLHYLATHRSQEISVSGGLGSVSAAGVQDQLFKMADYWTGIQQIA